MALNSIEETYRARTVKSAALLQRAAQSLPGGLKQALEAKAKALGISLYVLDEGSVMGLYFSGTRPIPGAPMAMIAMATTLDEAALAAASAGMCQALADIAP